ncbi:MAG: glycine C-acetyltransferase [Eubacteriales bacterium]|nr:glycine C-acetyltransferase [Clostridiales bacterium]MDY5836342.1 glycine C-acetyltransferase [Eubacteriales bacterium]
MKTGIKVISDNLQELIDAGTVAEERVITVPQGNRINTTKMDNVINMCANNYLGLANNPRIIKAAKESYDKWGYGLSSVRFICGTQQIHKDLEKALAKFFGFEDAILYSSCFDANGGLFQTITTKDDAIISDELNHASIIDGVRLSKAQRFVYKNNDMEDLEKQLQAADAAGAKVKLIATDGVFSMDGIIANLKGICDLADKYDALVMVDDSHASGFVGEHGRGTQEFCGVQGRVDIMTSTLGKALGGASGGFTLAKKEVIHWLREKSRPYLFSNTLAPAMAAASMEVLKLIDDEPERIAKVRENTEYFRKGVKALGLDVIDGVHPIVPVMVYDPVKAIKIANDMLELGVYCVAFKFPVVPRGKDRIRVQISAAHTKEDLDYALECFGKMKEKYGL